MATYYVSKGGNDSNAGTSKGAPKLTLGNAVNSVTHGDTVEILDEGAYNEMSISISHNDLTVTHTASWLGRPKIYGSDLGGGAGIDGGHAFKFGNITGSILQGLEVSNYGNYALHNGNQTQRTFHVTGCFFHNINKFTYQAIEGNGASGPDANQPATIFESIIYGDNQGNFSAPILVDASAGRLYIRNSFITASTDGYVIKNYAEANTTASFSTVINRHASTTYPVLQASKIINCIVSGTSANLKGIACDDGNHSYNLIDVGGTNFRLLADGADGSAGTGDVTGRPPEFLDGGAIGTGSSIVANYQLQEDSPAIGAGATYNSINIDISGTTRPQVDPGGLERFDIGCFEYVTSNPSWTSYTTEPDSNFSSTLVINSYNNLFSNHKVSYANNAGQVPFFLNIKGPVSLRKNKAYIATVSDPSNITGSS
jgi:hypothetical protein